MNGTLRIVSVIVLTAVGAGAGHAEEKCKDRHTIAAQIAPGWAKKCGTASASVGVGGGTVEAGSGLAVSVPYGAVDEPLTVSVTTTSAAPPDGIGALSPVYEFGPAGTVFARPVTVTLPIPAGVTNASVYWTKLGSTTEFEAIGGTISGDTISVEVAHFSLGVVGDGSPTRTINGVSKVTWLSATSRITVPQAQPVSAIVRDTGGNLVTLPATLGPDGTFSIAGVPSTGDYILRSGNQYMVTSTSAPDLGFVRGGRPDAIPLDGVSSVVELSISNLSPWQEGDMLEVFSSEVANWDFQSEFWASETGLEPGVTSAVLPIDMAFLFFTAVPNLIEGSKGDRLHVAQLVGETLADGTHIQTMSRLLTFPSFDMILGGTVALSGALLELAQSNSISFDMQGDAFRAALVADGHPDQVVDPCNGACGGSLGVFALPGTDQDGAYGASSDPLLISELPATRVQLGPIAYATPADADPDGTWGDIGVASWGGPVFYALPGKLPLGLPFGGSIVITGAPAAIAAPTVLVPTLTLPRNPTVDGGSFFADTTLATATPTIAWDPPATGTPGFYRVAVVELGVTANGLRTRRIQPNRARIVTRDTSFQLLPGTLQSGRHYVILIAAVDAPTADPDAPFRNVRDAATATVSSGIFTAP